LNGEKGIVKEFIKKYIWGNDMEESLSCSDYRDGDENQIIALFREAFAEVRSLNLWKWRFTKCPFGKGIIKLLFDKEKLVGHYAAIPMEVRVGDTTVKAIWSLDTMTHPDYRGRGVFVRLAKKVYEECNLQGYRFVYGFPNELIYPMRLKKLSWKGFGKMSILCKGLEDCGNMNLPCSVSSGYEINRIERFGDDVSLLWNKIKENYGVIVPRTKEFLNWRFVDHPELNYIIYIIKATDEETIGYIILKIYATESETKGHIIDILSIKNVEVVRQLIKCALIYFAKNEATNISCWMQDNNIYADVMKDEGFIRKKVQGSYPYFGVRIFNEEDIEVRSIESFPNWHLTMGDCDVF